MRRTPRWRDREWWHYWLTYQVGGVLLDLIDYWLAPRATTKGVWMPYLDHPGGWWQRVTVDTRARLTQALLLIGLLALGGGIVWLFERI